MIMNFCTCRLRVDDPSYPTSRRICDVVVSVGVAKHSAQEVPAGLTEQSVVHMHMPVYTHAHTNTHGTHTSSSSS